MALSDHLPGWVQRTARTLRPLTRALTLWNAGGGTNMSAATAFYGILSFAPLLLAIVAILGWWMDKGTLQHALVREIGSVLGPKGASLITDALASSKGGSQGIVASAIGFIVLLSGATGVFTELQTAFEMVWAHERGGPPPSDWKHTVTLRVRGVGYVLVFGFLLLVSLVISTMLSFLSDLFGHGVAMRDLAWVINELVGLVICTGVFFGLLRLSGGPKPRNRYLLEGAVIGAVLFTVGRYLLALYLSSAAVVSAYGAAGSLVVLLMWIYFSAAVLLFGASCARALHEHAGETQQQVRRVRVERRKHVDRRKRDRRHLQPT